MDDQYDEFKKFTDIITGDGKRRDKLAASAAGEDGEVTLPRFSVHAV